VNSSYSFLSRKEWNDILIGVTLGTVFTSPYCRKVENRRRLLYMMVMSPACSSLPLFTCPLSYLLWRPWPLFQEVCWGDHCTEGVRTGLLLLVDARGEGLDFDREEGGANVDMVFNIEEVKYQAARSMMTLDHERSFRYYVANTWFQIPCLSVTVSLCCWGPVVFLGVI
jgi:hypothetical protein